MSKLNKVFIMYPEGSEISQETPEGFHVCHVPLNKYCESKAIKDLAVHESNADAFVGILRYDYRRYVPAACCDFAKVAELMHGSYDVIGLYPFVQQDHHLFQFAEGCHPGFLPAWERLMKVLGEEDWAKHKDSTSPPAFYCNLWLMKTSRFVEYKAFLGKAMEAMETDAELGKLLHVDSKYKESLAFLDRSKISEVYGANVDYYPLHSFIQERLVCYWVHSRGLKVKLLTPDASEFHGHVFIKSQKKGGRLL